MGQYIIDDGIQEAMEDIRDWCKKHEPKEPFTIELNDTWSIRVLPPAGNSNRYIIRASGTIRVDHEPKEEREKRKRMRKEKVNIGAWNGGEI